MFILNMILSALKSLWAALCQEPANNVLGQDLPPDEPSDESTDKQADQPADKDQSKSQ